MSSIASDHPRPQPIWRLLTLFIVLCLIFIGFRFDAESFARSRIDRLASASGIDLNFDTIGLSGLGVRLEGVSIRSGRLPEPLALEYLTVTPELLSLLAGKSKAEVEFAWRGVRAGAIAGRRDALISLSDIHGTAGAADLLTIAEPYLHMPVKLTVAGDVALEGGMALSVASGVPQSGAMNLTWRGAKGSAMGVEVALGEVGMQLHNGNGGWQWKLATADSDLIRGEGLARAVGPAMARWPLGGDVTIDLAAINDPALLAWVPRQQQGKMLRLRVSGTLSAPRLEIVQ